MRLPAFSLERQAERRLRSFWKSVQFLVEIQNPCYDNGHRPGEAWRWRNVSWRQNGGCTQPETRTQEFFYLSRPQPIEKSRFQKINVNKRKQVCFRLFSFISVYLLLFA